MKHQLPPPFLRRKRQFFSDKKYNAFTEELETNAVTSVRVNPRKFAESFPKSEPVPWCEHGYYLSGKPVFTLDPLFHAGAYYPQEASSMVLWHILNVLTGESGKDLSVLDLCGAPGGKATLAASFLDGNGLLVTNEVVPSRARILQENIVKWGLPNVVVTQGAPPAFSELPGLFDVMMVDAPCSGEGMFRKGDTARLEWSEENAASCAVRQRHILRDSWAALKEGGWLIYSTCTFNPAENEENLRWLLKKFNAEVTSLDVPDEWGIETIPLAEGNALRFMPHKVRGEGFFVALVRKTGPEKAVRFPKNPKQRNKVPTVVRDLIENPDDFSFVEHDGHWRAVPLKYRRTWDLIQKHLNVFHSGLPIGNLARREILPSHELAMNVAFRQPYPVIELAREEALRYLKGEVPPVPADLSRGFVMATYNHLPLGFLKNVGNRFNNLYPKNWRIRMDISVKNS